MKRYLAGDLLPERREGFLEVLLLAGRLPRLCLLLVRLPVCVGVGIGHERTHSIPAGNDHAQD